MKKKAALTPQAGSTKETRGGGYGIPGYKRIGRRGKTQTTLIIPTERKKKKERTVRAIRLTPTQCSPIKTPCMKACGGGRNFGVRGEGGCGL